MLTQITGCGTATQSHVQSESDVNTINSQVSPFLDVDIPRDQVKPEQLHRSALGLLSIVKDGTESMPLKKIVDSLQLEGPVLDVIPGILESHPGPITVTCKNLTCNGKSTGKAHSFLVDFIDLPLFGKPTVFLEPSIEMELTLSEDGQFLEICRIKGVQTKARGMGGNIDGFIFQLKDQVAEVLKIDIGFGGSYPNDRCKITSQS